ncbi:type II CRISPR-associated endonuclease Cas1 [Treponema denticola]|jgi:CRISPR-associated endonuclease cas1, NMENI subtype|uniref:CRISPR-associated endonuclease Cas1 n=2 Tax=Treponema denticola TaxID=158 RepID=M2C7P8_TREDN|nr:type II CRISPR-associated endonuclease Cas1 [Treponema denticola]EMB32450.1 CRISPR-associated endonuclease cas1, subtype II/nmeni [Treponema denticola MYR-T]EMB32526.1 CRISPR-associated endonuclease cas1, subtype II/nmeni [Treponema denticola H-22]EMB33337.1 CRISPR-associated endonuclease cas1, subtype II/nmeni [Treponema denticola H1-T]EMB42969.1 CRISPR-associated endonuclease cas1, subtype II/nmeni [Treponema denticola ATCC 33520]UTC86212.1 type II CRISPR-associated endonuclease Cas1 [Tre
MSWRTVVISNRAKLDLHLNHLVVRGEKTQKVFIEEISVLIIETTAVSITAALLNELIKQKVKVIFCDEKRNPASELIGYYGSHDTSEKIRLQIKWDKNIKQLVWTEVVTEKIRQQKYLLEKLNLPQASLLAEYITDIDINDKTNKEAHAAKAYFAALFGAGFSRSLDIPINAALNYGYSILLSAFNREIIANGYITQLGIFHDNMFNPFNLGSDLMEPFRPLVDAEVFKLNPQKFEHEEKLKIVSVINKKVLINNKEHYLNKAIEIFVHSIFDALNEKDISQIKFYRNEL